MRSRIAFMIAIGLTTQAGCLQPGALSREESEKLPSLQITRGLEKYQVIQRDEHNVGTVRCEGTCAVSGQVWARILRGKVWGKASMVGKADGSRWSATIENISPGGPYDIELSVRSEEGRVLARTSAGDVLVGDLWILAGQSNMQGWGDMVDVEEPSPSVHAFESRYQWAVAEEPLHRLNESPNAVHHRIANPKLTREEIDKIRTAPRKPSPKGTGLGLPFAKELYARTGVPIGLVPCAHGGTSMTQWDPARRDEGGDSLYGSMYDRFKAVGGKVRGALWYQGESDANPKAQPEYYGKFKAFIEAVRRDFGDPELPFYLVQLSRVNLPMFEDKWWNAVQEDERRIAGDLPHVVTVPAIDLDLDDIIHIGTPGLKRLGRRMARVADRDLFGNTKVDIGPQLVSAALEKPGVIRVTYARVNGSLRPREFIGGFSLRTADGKPAPEFYDAVVDPERPNTVLCQFAGDLPAGAQLWYGYGRNPYCNLTDDQDMAAPVFGPIPIAAPATAAKP